MTEIQSTLRRLGITRCYNSFKHTAYAIQLAVQNEDCLEAMTKEIYMVTADRFGCKWTAVERNIRTAVLWAWAVDLEFLRRMAGYPLAGAPTASKFIEIIASYILRADQAQSSQRPAAVR